MLSKFLLFKTYEGMQRDLQELEVTAFANQMVRFEAQKIGDEEAEVDAVLDHNHYKRDIQMKMIHASTASRGFILWLDFERSNSLVDNARLLQRPPLLPKLDGIQVVDKDLEHLEVTVNSRASASAKLIAYARTITAVARKTLADVDSGNILKAHSSDNRPIHGEFHSILYKLIHIKF